MITVKITSYADYKKEGLSDRDIKRAIKHHIVGAGKTVKLMKRFIKIHTEQESYWLIGHDIRNLHICENIIKSYKEELEKIYQNERKRAE